MKRRAILLVAACALLILGIARSGTATAAPIYNMQVPVAGVLPNPCTGEPMDFTGSIHMSGTVTTTASGTFHLDFHDNAAGIKAIGETTGAQYIGTQNDHFTINTAAGGTITENGSFKAIGQGSLPNWTSSYLLHVTVDANGNLTAYVDNFTANCS
ncbi:MAG TPA: hypothetical protein VFB58_16300 [Chloroflexota bacterium]|nr:hypothetical protein [Chloroflexota bacterium]